MIGYGDFCTGGCVNSSLPDGEAMLLFSVKLYHPIRWQGNHAEGGLFE